MRKILTEENLRSRWLSKNFKQVFVTPDVFVTENAVEYMKKHSIELTVTEAADSTFGSMSSTPIAENGAFTYIDAKTGEGYSEKPEDMTHLRANLLVKKTDPRIEFRGKLDTLQAQIILVQVLADKHGEIALVDDLSQVLDFVRNIMSAEVKDEPVGEIRLFGLDGDEIRYNSHFVAEVFGIKHPIPSYKMGELAAHLNMLRCVCRETELSAVRAFENERPDIIQALNRLSGAVYILECRLLSDKKKTRQV